MAALLKSVKQDIMQRMEAKQWAELRTIFSTWQIPEIADFLLTVDGHKRVILFRTLPRTISADVFSYLEPDGQDELLHELTSAETRHILTDLPPDDRTALLEELPATATKRLMRLLSFEDLKEARLLLGYPDESVGRLMTPHYVSVSPAMSVAEAIERIRVKGQDSETINRIYVSDERGKLLDDIILRRLILASPQQLIRELMDENFIRLSAFDDREKAVRLMQRYDMVALPVVDSDNVLIGIVTVDDVMDVAEEEMTEDIHKAASVEPLKMSYRRASVWTLFRKRIFWLVILVVLNLFSASIIAMYEHALATAIALTSFIPLLLGSGGNAGAQSSTIMLRALVTGDVAIKEWFQSFVKELAVGALLGVTLGGLGFLLGFIYHGTSVPAQIGFIVGITMICVIMVANIVGMTLPFVLARLKLDPAVASSPLITTIADVTGLMIYFSIAAAIL
jgi:magnesium transporter